MYMQLRDNVQEIVGEIIIFNLEHPYEQKLKGYTLKQKDIEQLEQILPELIPNIIITHSQTDTEEEQNNLIKKVRSIYANNMYPYFIDLNVQTKKLTRTLK